MIRQVSEESVHEAADRADVQREFDNLLAAAGRMDRAAEVPTVPERSRSPIGERER